MPDRVDRLREAAQARHESTLLRATSALQRMARRGEAVTFRQLAETAGVSRSWLYRQPQLREEIDRLRRPTRKPALRRASHNRFVAPAIADLSQRDHPAADREPGTPRPTGPAPRRSPSRSSHEISRCEHVRDRSPFGRSRQAAPRTRNAKRRLQRKLRVIIIIPSPAWRLPEADAAPHRAAWPHRRQPPPLTLRQTGIAKMSKVRWR
jgi:hypothetical protein